MKFKNLLLKKCNEIGLLDMIHSPLKMDTGTYLRPMIRYISQNSGINQLTGAELGVAKGVNAYSMLNELPIKKLYLVDPYVGEYFEKSGYKGMTGDEMFELAQKNLRHFNNVSFIRDYAENAVKQIPDDLDFVYIDSEHTFEATKKQIQLYHPKVKVGGVLGGHDFCEEHIGVCEAVIESRRNFNVNLKLKNNDWWFVKNEEEKRAGLEIKEKKEEDCIKYQELIKFLSNPNISTKTTQ